MTSTVSRNYARALFELARETSTLDAVEADIRASRDTLFADRAVRDFLGNRLIGRTTKKAVIRAGLEGKVDGRVLSLLCLLAERGRVRLLGEIAEELERLARLARGVRRVRIATAFALDASEEDRVRRSLEARYGGRVELEIEVRPALIGGMVAESEGQEIELSLEGSLKGLREGLGGRTERGKG